MSMTESEPKKIKVLVAGGDRGAGKALKAQMELLEELEEYRAIGTVEELKQLKEKAIKKIERYKDKHYCECGCPVEIMLDGITLKPIGGQIYCDQCGAKLDWSDFVEEKGE